ncbi:hypothetical protein [Spirosoma utsteinense]|uniref:PAS domain-containing protein n=1 Tax=Spirosoma utsteinense TaxID=2585773 RepID=A0ABR6W782_9BACT|nr:hypothetical protein [Spirosoma utsteinense]MBC3785811.1 hypothetical protein [Spirosoma utsteinense]MBC3791983.1 hypothetical protein [Spirosoma utsteinense]
MVPDPQQQVQKLMRFMHHAPLAMVETDLRGTLLQVNPKALQLMMPMAAYLGLPGDNLLDTLTGFLPAVGQAVARFDKDSGMIIDQEPYRIEFQMNALPIERFFSLTIEKLGAEILLIFFDDVTDFLLKADQIRQPL